MITQEEIKHAYAWLTSATTEYRQKADAEIIAKDDLDRAKLAGLFDGTIDGKNDTMREAAAREQLLELYEQYETLSHNARTARLEFDLATLRVDELKMLMRLAEITVQDGKS